jgi:hypothetical protein
MTSGMRPAILALVLAGCSAQIESATVDAGAPGVDAPGSGRGSGAADDSQTGIAPGGLTASFTIGTTLVTTANVNLRSGPHATDSVIEVIASGTPVSTVFQKAPEGGWYRVLSGDHVGWSSGLYLEVGHPPPAHTLPTATVKRIVEPPGSGNDDHGHAYSDQNYWNFCGPGAATAVLAFFSSHVTTWPAGSFSEPYGPHTSTTYWASSDSGAVGRAYLMHIALQVKPPTFSTAGLASFTYYPTHGTQLANARDVLNWEASGHASGWSTFFYQDVAASGLSATTLHHDITRDISGGHAVFADVDTGYLPNWSRSLGHSIAIIGYDDTAGTYAYVDTCGTRCNGSAQATNGGVHHVAQSRMHTAITSFGVGYAR